MNIIYITVITVIYIYTINSYDIETYKKNGFYIPYCVCFIINKKNFEIYYQNEKDIILESIDTIFTNIKNEIIIYVHNIKFDGSFIIDSVSKRNKYKIKCVIENKKIYVLSILFKNKKIIFRCSYKLLPLSLENISRGFNLSKKIDYPYSFIKEDNLFLKGFIEKAFFKSTLGYEYYNSFLDLKKFTINYCHNDCLITKDFVTIIFNIFKNELKINILNKNILSAPSLSYYIFYKKFNKKKINKEIKKEIELYIRDSYFGGRCEVFGNALFNEKTYHFDFSGMYGMCMKEKNVYGNPTFYYNFDNNSELKPGFYNINWKSEKYIPVLPHHNIITNKLLFTNGNGNGTYWFEEINLFKKMGGKIEKINSGLIYPNYDFIFNEFVEYFEKFRKINETYKTLGKLMINSFYGRTGLKSKEIFSFFVQKKEELETIINLSDNNLIEIESLDEINNIWFINIYISEISIKILNKIGYNFKKKKSFNIAIASSITSKARIKLYKGFIDVQNAGGRILYCDTDSIIASFENEVNNETHGEIYWDITKEDTIIKDSVFIAPKTYALLYNNNKSITKIKGVKRDYISLKNLKEKFYNKENLMIINLEQIKNINFKIEYRNVNKKIDLIGYDKRKFSKDLYTTRPLKYINGHYI